MTQFTRTIGLRLAVVAIATALAAGSASAQSVADFYKGKDVKILVGGGVGGGYDTYTRLLARHWGKYIPGKPNLVVQNMPGAQGIKMMNFLTHKAKKDGTVIGSPYAAGLIEPVLSGGKATRYDSRKMNWVGNISPQYNACFVKKTSSIKTFEDAMKKQVILATTSARSSSAIMANVYNIMMGTKFKVITGYKTSEVTLAMERGEAEGTCLSYATLIARVPELIEKKKINWLVVLNNKEVPELPGIPPATKFAKNDEERQVLEILISRNLMGRPFVMAPEVPKDRLAAIRASFFKVLKDPTYLAEAKKLKMIVDPVDHKAMMALVNRTYNLPPKIIKMAVDLTSGAAARAKKSEKRKKK